MNPSGTFNTKLIKHYEKLAGLDHWKGYHLTVNPDWGTSAKQTHLWFFEDGFNLQVMEWVHFEVQDGKAHSSVRFLRNPLGQIVAVWGKTPKAR